MYTGEDFHPQRDVRTIARRIDRAFLHAILLGLTRFYRYRVTARKRGGRCGTVVFRMDWPLTQPDYDTLAAIACRLNHRYADGTWHFQLQIVTQSPQATP